MFSWFLSPRYGTVIPELQINGTAAPYGVVNENVVRAGAGIMFFLGGIAFAHAVLIKNFTWAAVIIPFFWTDFLLKVIFGPHASPISRIAELSVAHDQPKWVAATPKRFAWTIGLILATIAWVLIFSFEIRGVIPMLVCGTCLIFMWLETSVGYCAGCHIYAYLLNKNLIPRPQVTPSCGEGKACPILKNS